MPAAVATTAATGMTPAPATAKRVAAATAPK